MPQIGVAEQGVHRVDVDRLAADEAESGRVVHPRVDGDDHPRAGEAGEDDRQRAEHVRARRQAVPAVDVDPDEDRLEEEREALDREAEAEDAAERGREVRPQQAHLEAEDRARDDAHGEEGDHDPAPAAGDREVDRVAGAVAHPLHDQHHHGKGDAEAHERDVHGERERLHLARLQQVVLLHRAQRLGQRDQRGQRHPASLVQQARRYQRRVAASSRR